MKEMPRELEFREIKLSEAQMFIYGGPIFFDDLDVSYYPSVN